ncbi:biotin carboxyl carrier protein of acetyl-CoA carboxylase 2, chloroplastic-like isoform X2 [Curcuma longa]|uniref:biotin carboxyl carrier protein of acetyl-CoA carboxylase 2, chloroplastic-like isoform X2 n=1 Tax=Curcuma longa TaxID=136217 RepID=UPI003D9EA246
MATISVPCPKCSAIPRSGAGSRNSSTMASISASFLKPGPSSIPGSTRFPSLKERNHGHFPILKAQSNSSPLVSTKSDTQFPKSEDADLLEESSGQHGMMDTTMSTLMSEVSSLVVLVDSKDIAELHLKKDGCEILIRKKEALPQPEIVTPPMMLQNQPIFQPQPSVTPIVSPPTPPAPSKALPAPSAGPSTTASKSPLPALKCPMAGTFYRCPAPGEPPFVKVGDKVQKGQAVCIVEAMKLMNEIEADKSGTVVEILVEDAKPVSVDTPLLIIQP